jgi:hypothetical protein
MHQPDSKPGCKYLLCDCALKNVQKKMRLPVLETGLQVTFKLRSRTLGNLHSTPIVVGRSHNYRRGANRHDREKTIILSQQYKHISRT